MWEGWEEILRLQRNSEFFHADPMKRAADKGERQLVDTAAELSRRALAAVRSCASHVEMKIVPAVETFLTTSE